MPVAARVETIAGAQTSAVVDGERVRHGRRPQQSRQQRNGTKPSKKLPLCATFLAWPNCVISAAISASSTGCDRRFAVVSRVAQEPRLCHDERAARDDQTNALPVSRAPASARRRDSGGEQPARSFQRPDSGSRTDQPSGRITQPRLPACFEEPARLASSTPRWPIDSAGSRTADECQRRRG
jgi:hypothetical protein